MGRAVDTIDITRAAAAYRAIGAVEAVARLVYALGVPASAFVLAFDFGRGLELGARLGLWAGLTALLLAVVLPGFSFAVRTLRPLVGFAFLLLGAGPGLYALGQYLISGSSWLDAAPIVLIIAALAVPLLRAWFAAGRLSPAERRIARPAPPLASPLALAREIFGLWPGFKRSWLNLLGAALLTHASTILLWVGGFVLLPVAVLTLLLSPLMLHTGKRDDALILIALIALAALAINLARNWLRAGARWMSRASLEQQVARDQRPPTLFLRSFRDDQVRLPERGPVSALIRRVLSLGVGPRRLDHILVEQFSRHGPAVALGSPGEKDLPFGAARIYCSHQDWKQTVADLAERAGAVLLVIDRTPGVEWEISTFLAGPLLPKVLFLSAPRGRGLTEHPLMAGWLAEAGVTDETGAIIAAFQNESGGLTVLRAATPRTPESYTVALRAFFRR